MSNNTKPHSELVGTRVRHDFSRRYIGTITKTHPDVRGYCYYVEWETDPERSDWFQLNVLEKLRKDG